MAATAQAASAQAGFRRTTQLRSAVGAAVSQTDAFQAQAAAPTVPRALPDAGNHQLALYGRPRISARGASQAAEPPRCAGCREKEARYGFRNDDDPIAARPRTLCFECFRVEIGRRQAVAAQLARGWNARQVGLPLEEKLETLSLRRRRAQIAARHALGI